MHGRTQAAGIGRGKDAARLLGLNVPPAPGQRAVSTGTLNVRGRMGSPDSEIYLCNAAVIAASAIEGKISDPRPYLQG